MGRWTFPAGADGKLTLAQLSRPQRLSVIFPRGRQVLALSRKRAARNDPQGFWREPEPSWLQQEDIRPFFASLSCTLRYAENLCFGARMPVRSYLKGRGCASNPGRQMWRLQKNQTIERSGTLRLLRRLRLRAIVQNRGRNHFQSRSPLRWCDQRKGKTMTSPTKSPATNARAEAETISPEERIRERAYKRYLQHDGQPGADLSAAPAASASYMWHPPGKRVSVRLSLDVVERLGFAVVEGFKSLPKRGLEVGGLLLGCTETPEDGTVISVQDFEPSNRSIATARHTFCRIKIKRSCRKQLPFPRASAANSGSSGFTGAKRGLSLRCR